MRARTSIVIAAIVGGVAVVACEDRHVTSEKTASGNIGASQSVADLMKARGLTEADVEAALKTYVPSGKLDEYYIFASGGQSGNINVIGVPSMRMLKVIG